jgi:hypothetical protein
MLDIPSRNVVWVSNSKELICLHVKRLWPMPDWCISGTAWPMHLQRLLRDSNDQHIFRFGPFCFQPCMPFEVSDYSLRISFCETTCMGSLFCSGPRADFMKSKLSISLMWCQWDVDPTFQFNAKIILSEISCCCLYMLYNWSLSSELMLP